MTDGAHRGMVGGFLVAGAVIVVFIVFVVTSASPTGTVAAGSTPAARESLPESVAPVSGYDRIVVRVDIARNETAHWSVEYRYELADAAAQEAFNRTARNITNPPGVFINRMQDNAVSDAENRTGRSMRLENGRVETDVDTTAGEGIVRYHFAWTNFAARPAADRFVVGDAIGGYDIGANESLMIEWSDSFRRASVSPEPDLSQENAVCWTGPLRFRTEDPTVALIVTGSGGPAGPPILPVVAAFGLLLAVGVGWYGRSRWRSEEDADTEQITEEPPDELLSDEERVLQLLESRGGRMKQQDLLEEVEWSRTKASEVVNGMNEAGQIEVFRLGRENVLALPGEIEI